MPTSLTLDTVRLEDGNLVLIASGEIDLSNVDAFDQALAAVLTAANGADGSAGRLVVDLSAVEYLDSAAINVLFAHADRIDLIAHPLLMSTLTLSGLSGLVSIELAQSPARD